MADSKAIAVALGVIIDDKQRALVTLRAKDSYLGNRYEFPGGKIEGNESPLLALKRELKEELGVAVDKARLVLTVPYQYPTVTVVLSVFLVEAYRGKPQLLAAQQALCWQEVRLLHLLDFPEANQAIIDYLMAAVV